MNKTQRLRTVERDQIVDPEMVAILEKAERLSAPKPEWYLATAHSPEACKAFDHFWDTVFRHGRVEHLIKEMMRLTIVQLLDCDFCSSQRSVQAQHDGLDEASAQACALPDFNPPDERLGAALRYARVLCTTEPSENPGAFDEAYGELHQVFDDEEVTELVYLAMISIGGTMVTRGLNLT